MCQLTGEPKRHLNARVCRQVGVIEVLLVHPPKIAGDVLRDTGDHLIAATQRAKWRTAVSTPSSSQLRLQLHTTGKRNKLCTARPCEHVSDLCASQYLIYVIVLVYVLILCHLGRRGGTAAANEAGPNSIRRVRRSWLENEDESVGVISTRRSCLVHSSMFTAVVGGCTVCPVLPVLLLAERGRSKFKPVGTKITTTTIDTEKHDIPRIDIVRVLVWCA